MPDSQSVEYKVKVDEFEFTFTNEQLDAADLVQQSPGKYNLLKNHQW